MHYRFCSSVLLVLSAGLLSVSATLAADEANWLTPSIGPLSPSLHFNGTVGDSSADPETLAVGHHDPTREDGTVQGIEAGLALRIGMVQGFATYSLHYGADEEWENEWEEAFLKLKEIPGGFEVRGGRALARYGRHNTQHLHSWSFVNMPLVWGRFLGDDGLIMDGGDLTWLKQGIGTTFGVTVGYGDAKAHDHGHAEDDEHAEDDDDADGDEHAEDHDHDEHAHHAEVTFADDVASGRAFAQYRKSDFHAFETGASVAVGDDASGRQVAVYGVDFAYTWREKGMAAGGRSLTWLTEALYRDVDDGEFEEAHEEHAEEEEDHEEHDDEMLPGGSEFGFYSHLVFSLNRVIDLGARVGYVAGSNDLESEERFRISPAITAYLDPYRRTSVRAQYNYDDLTDDGKVEHTAWLQLGVNWGASEVR